MWKNDYIENVLLHYDLKIVLHFVKFFTLWTFYYNNNVILLILCAVITLRETPIDSFAREISQSNGKC